MIDKPQARKQIDVRASSDEYADAAGVVTAVTHLQQTFRDVLDGIVNALATKCFPPGVGRGRTEMVSRERIRSRGESRRESIGGKYA